MNSVDFAYENMVAQEWEDQNKTPIEDALRKASDELETAIKDLGTACNSVSKAADVLDDSPVADRVISIMNDMEDVLSDLRTMQRNWRHGVV